MGPGKPVVKSEKDLYLRLRAEFAHSSQQFKDDGADEHVHENN